MSERYDLAIIPLSVFFPTSPFDFYKATNTYLRAAWHAIAPHSSRISAGKETRIASASLLFRNVAGKFTDSSIRLCKNQLRFFY